MTWQDSVRVRMARNGYTQREVARRMGVSESYWADVRKGRRPLTADLAIRVEYALGLRAGDLLRMQAVAQAAAEVTQAQPDADDSCNTPETVLK